LLQEDLEISVHPLTELMTDGDQLWRYHGRVFDPWAMVGSEGLAVVRDGEIVDHSCF